MSALEGFLVRYKGYVWVVKGVDACSHVIAFPRYDLRGKKLDRDVVDLLTRDALRTSDCSPVPVPALDPDEAEVLDPRSLIDADPIAKEFSKLFPCEAGLTGSRIFGRGSGDVDLVFYDDSCFGDVIEVLKELKEKGVVTSPLLGKWDGLGERAAKLRRRYALLEGVWKGTPFSIRLVKGPRSPRRPVRLKWDVVEGRVLVSTPTTPTLIRLDTGVTIESLRLQHAEVPPGSLVKVKGTWEMRTDGLVLTLPRGARLEIVAI